MSGKDISESTKVTVGVVALLLALAFYLGYSWNTIESIQIAQANSDRVIFRIDTRLSRIEGAMGLKPLELKPLEKGQ